MNFSKPLIVAAVIGFCSSCASIVSKTNWPVTIDSTPREASIVITDRRGEEVYSGRTPTLVRLRSGAGFFQAARYKITISKPGYQDRTINMRATVNGWYFGNILFGGLIGFLIVDPATGAMYRLNTLDINEPLAAAPTTASAKTVPGLRVYDINNIPAAWKEKLELLAKQ